jgi:flagellar motor switch protein FliM
MSSNSPHPPETTPQEEEDILLSGGGETTQEVPSVEKEGSEVHLYDFRRPARLSKDRKRSLEAIYGLLAKALEGWLRGRVRDPISLDLESVEEVTFGEFQIALPSPCASFIVDDTRGSGHQGVIDFGQELAFFLVDRLLGGTSQPALFERSLTPTERLLVRIVAERVTAQLSDVWKDYVEMELSISGFESIPEMLLVANREDSVLVCTLTVSTGDMSSPLTLCLPVASLEKFFISTGSRRVPVAQGNPEERTVERQNVEGTLRSARIPVQARFKEVSLTLRDLAALKPGHIMKTGLSTDAELFILVAGQKRFVGAPGKLGGHLATLVKSETDAEPDDVIQPGRGGN